MISKKRETPAPLERKLSGIPLTAAAFTLPFLTTLGILVLLTDAGVPLPSLWLLLPVSFVVGFMELASGIFMTGIKASEPAVIRRHIFAAALLYGITYLLSGFSGVTALGLGSLFIIQWFGSSNLRNMTGPLKILQQYAGDRTGAELARKMRETQEEARKFYWNLRTVRLTARIYAGVLILLALLLSLAGIRLSVPAYICLVAIILFQYVITFFASHMETIQGYLHEGIRMPAGVSNTIGAAAVMLLSGSILIALVITPGKSLFPTQRLLDWLASLTAGNREEFFRAQEILHSQQASHLAAVLEQVQDNQPNFRIDLILRYLGYGIALFLIFLLFKPLFRTAFYHSLRDFHPLRIVISAIRKMLMDMRQVSADFLSFLAGIFKKGGIAEDPLVHWGLPSRKKGTRFSIRKRREQRRVLKELLDLMQVAVSAGIPYRDCEGPGTFLEHVQAWMEDKNLSPAEQVPKIQDHLDFALYARTPLPAAALSGLLGDLQACTREIRQYSES